ncbi:COX15/CtaA family protein [Sansalvadorimonas sp. 2012CJ34-2]|uniref:COX15/CtaA family protein n=1 Tax=Parendozoicomonas callyspongiae TaxID=2942213 RepID=A0ABT0PAV5_9GAMM|nr:COX15/CtaA family protein [Sansalvadorimonas sp. 2012CJ34-2]MCL6268484.1 COX15/CtaA family protein [Sansalvadorimonas sp. 2012CJ34-2]
MSEFAGNSGRKPGFWLAVIATALAVVVVGLGAWTRLVHAGLGCPDWPGCYGFLTVPDSAAEIRVAEARFPDAPVEVDKGWPEMIHRYVAGALLLLVAGLATSAIRNRKREGQPFKLPLLIFALIILQAAFGMWTVTLKLWPQVVTAHLLGGFATLSLLTLLAFRLSGGWRPRLKPPQLKTLAGAGLLVVVLQITLGGWTSSNYAALACPDFPLCQGQVWPNMDFEQGLDVSQSIGPNYLGGQLDNSARTAIHMAHRIGAIITLLVVGALVLVGLREGNSGIRNYSRLVLFALLLQVSLGVSNIIFYLPLSVAVAHNLGGAFLLVSLLMLNYRLRYEQIERP